MSKIALVGCGKHMRSRLVPCLAQLDGFEVEVCVDRDEGAAQAVQLRSRAKSWATSIEAADMSNIDAAIIALPSDASYGVVSYLINRGVACFVEKPPANTTDEIRRLVQLASAMEVHVQVGFNFRFAEAITTLFAHVSEYRECPCTASIDFRSKHPSGPEWGIEDPVAAWLYHNGVHALDLLLWTLGDVRRVNASITRTTDEKFTIVAMTEHVNHSAAILRLGTLTEKFDLRTDLFTPDAHQYSLPHLGEVVMLLQNGKVAGELLYRTSNLDNGWGRAGYGPELQHFLSKYRTHNGASPSLLDALKASELCDAIMHSLKTGTAYIFLD